MKVFCHTETFIFLNGRRLAYFYTAKLCSGALHWKQTSRGSLTRFEPFLSFVSAALLSLNDERQ
jgi:hypothetical protein